MDGLMDNAAFPSYPAMTGSTVMASERRPETEEILHVGEMLSRIDEDIAHHQPAFDRMKEDIAFNSGEMWPGMTKNDTRYVCNFVQLLVRKRVSALYAKNPTVSVRRRPRMDFQIWDEDFQSLQAALQNPMDPMNAALLQEVAAVASRRAQIDGLAKTLEIATMQEIEQQEPNFKRQMKKLVRRTETCGVGYVKLDFLRENDVSPDIEGQINTLANQLKNINYLAGMLESGEIAEDDREAQELKIQIQGLQERKYILKQEGIVFRFPRSMAVIPDKECTQLEGWIGANHVVEHIPLTGRQIKKYYGVDISSGGAATAWKPGEKEPWPRRGFTETRTGGVSAQTGYHDVFLVHDREMGMKYMLCRGYEGYLEKPAPSPIITRQFYPYFALTFNDIEDDRCIFAPSTSRLVRHQQIEFNRKKEAERQHRIANRPQYAHAFGVFDAQDKHNLSDYDAHESIELSQLEEGQSVDDLLQQIKKHPVDPALYNTNDTFDDVTKIVPMPPASMSVVRNSTATANSIAEDSHQSDTGSNADDQDDFLSILFREVGHNIMVNYSRETVVKLVGAGAVWPSVSHDDIFDEIYLSTEAGSSGRPNRAAQTAAIQRLYPLMIQLPGVNPEWLIKKTVKLVDENVDISDAYLKMMPSIISMNQMAGQSGQPGQPPTGNPDTEPGMQGREGRSNAPAGPRPPALPAAPVQGTMMAGPGPMQGGMMRGNPGGG